jgi:hypothetical protein
MLHYVSHDCMYGSHNVGAAHGRGGLVTFDASKVTKNAFSRKASLPHGPLPCKSGKTGAAPSYGAMPCRALGLHCFA